MIEGPFWFTESEIQIGILKLTNFQLHRIDAGHIPDLNHAAARVYLNWVCKFCLKKVILTDSSPLVSVR